MKEVRKVVELAKSLFRADLVDVSASGGFTKSVYVRYLSFQYHLTKGVQKHFLKVAAHPSLAGRRRLRDFLYTFALEEEPHFDVARHDLENMGVAPLPCSLDVKLWWAYFDRIVETQPFVRLGATCVLENLGAGAGGVGRELLANAPFVNESNTRFLDIHFHEELPHGDQIFAALESVKLSQQELDDLVDGAKTGAILYLRMARWAMGIEELANTFSIHSESNCA